MSGESRPQIQDVNIELGDDVSRMLYEASKATYANRPGLMEEVHASFSGFRALPLGNLIDVKNLYSNMGFDGVGTKVEVSERLEDHSTVAFDLFAMVVDDAVVRGAEPLTIGSILDVRQLENTDYARQAVRQLASGYIQAAKAAGVVIVNGEAAELGDRIGGHGNFNYNWGATTWWVAHKDRALTGKQIEPGQTLVGLREEGFRSNGITDVRKALLAEYGPDWHHKVINKLGTISLGRLVQKPSTIYSRFVSELTGGYDITREPKATVMGVAHITGGGQPSKLQRMLEPSGYGVLIDNPIEPPQIMKHVQELRGFTDEQAYGKWHMGPGMVLVTSEPHKIIDLAPNFGIEAKAIGMVTQNSDIQIKNCGANQSTDFIRYSTA